MKAGGRLFLVSIIASMAWIGPTSFVQTISRLLWTLASHDASQQGIKSAIVNATTDFYELTRFLEEFFASPDVDPGIKVLFTAYLQKKAAKSHKTLEIVLDWLLFIYKCAFPFIIVSFLSRFGKPPTKKRKPKILGKTDSMELPWAHVATVHDAK